MFTRSAPHHDSTVIAVVPTAERSPAQVQRIRAQYNTIGRRPPIIVADDWLAVAELVRRGGVLAVHVQSADPRVLLNYASLSVPVIWDISGRSGDNTPGIQDARAVGQATCVVDAPGPFRRETERRFQIGLSSLDLSAALRVTERRVLVAVGSGLGNVVYATPLIRWLSEHSRAPVDVVIHKQGPQAIEVLSEASEINCVFPNAGSVSGRSYEYCIATGGASNMELPVSAETYILPNRFINFNREGRFIPECAFYFLGMSEHFPEYGDPFVNMPPPFIRDIDYQFKSTRIVGLANGVRSGVWSKRQWPYATELTKRLSSQGYVVRSFGTKEEYVEGAEDYTDLTIRDTAYAIAECSWFIGHDGGLNHIADALGVPTLWLFGPTGHIKNGPVFGLSTVLTSKAPCGSCNFKVDFQRCGVADCMTALGIERVLGAFEGMRERVERQGYHRKFHERLDWPLLSWELDSVDTPLKRENQLLARAQRFEILPQLTGLFAELTLANLKYGDVENTSELLSEALCRWPQDPVLLTWQRCVEVFHKTRLPRSSGSITTTAELLGNLHSHATTVAERTMLAHAALAAAAEDWSEVKTAADAAIQLSRVSEHQRTATGFAIEARLRTDGFASARELWRSCRRLLRVGVCSHLIHLETLFERSTWRDSIEALLPLEIERLRHESGARKMDFELCDKRILFGNLAMNFDHLAKGDRIVLVTPEAPASALPTSRTRFLTSWLQQLANSGIHVMVAYVYGAKWPEAVKYRDSILYVATHPFAGGEMLEELSEITAPKAIFVDQAAASAFNLAGSLAERPVYSIGVTSDCSRMIFPRVGLVSVEAVYDCQDSPTDAGGVVDLHVDSIIESQRQRNGAAEYQSAMRGFVLAIPRSYGEFRDLIKLARCNPQARFRIVSRWVSRGYETNVEFCNPRALADEPLPADVKLVVDYSQASGSLSPLLHQAARHGVPALTAFEGQLPGGQSVRIEAPEKLEAWHRAIQMILHGEAVFVDDTQP